MNGRVPQRLVVGLAVAEDLRADVSRPLKPPVDGERQSESGAEGEDELGARALDATERSHGGVVDDAHVASTRLTQGVLEVKAAPLPVDHRVLLRRGASRTRKVAGRHHDTVAELPGKAHPDASTPALGDPLL